MSTAKEITNRIDTKITALILIEKRMAILDKFELALPTGDSHLFPEIYFSQKFWKRYHKQIKDSIIEDEKTLIKLEQL